MPPIPMIDRRQVLAGLAGVGAWGLSGCGGGQAEDSSAGRIRLANLSNGYAALDLQVQDERAAAGVAQGAVSGYASVDSNAALATVVTAANSASALVSSSTTLAKAQAATLVAWGWAGALRSTLLTEDLAAADGGKTRLRVLNLAPDAGVLDVYLTASTDDLGSATAVASAVEADAVTDALQQAAGTWRLRVTAAGDRSDLRLDVDGLTLGSTEVVTLVLTPAAGGVLVQAHRLVQGGEVATSANPQGRARVVASVANHAAVTASLNGTGLASALVSPGIGGFQRFAAGDGLALAVTVAGTLVPVAPLNLPAGGDYTVLVWGTEAAPRVAVLTEDLRLPTGSSQASVRVLHAVNGLDAGLTLTVDFSARVDNVQPGTASGWALVSAGSAVRLDLGTALSNTPLYSAANLTLAAGGLYTLFLLGDAGAPLAAFRRER